MSDSTEAKWQFVYMRNVDIGRVAKHNLDNVWNVLGINSSDVACASAVGAYLAEFVVRTSCAKMFVAQLSNICVPSGLDVRLAVREDTDYSPMHPYAHVIPDSCAVPERALRALDAHARSSVVRRWGRLYYAAEHTGVRTLIAQTLRAHGLCVPAHTMHVERTEPARLVQPADIVRQRAPNHAILSADHLAELVPTPTHSRLVIYTDGAYLPERGSAGIGAYIANSNIPPLAQRVRGRQSAARAEIQAAQLALDHVLQTPRSDQWREIWVCTDSQYVVDAVNVNSETWARANWVSAKGRPIANRREFQLLFAAIHRASTQGHMVFVHHLPAHFDIAGNDVADTLAKAGALL
ncbi:Ribonuclease H1 [Coemansia sp. RSA 1199]|nr:Ribonuclease H1 [Coemansia sp. RSA 1199]